MNIQGVIFDVDGTLLDTERIHLEVWKIVTARHGYTVDEKLLLKTRGLNKEASRDYIRAALGGNFDYDGLRVERHRLEEKLIADRSPILMPGVLKTLEWLRAKGIPLAVASSTRTSATRLHLEQSNIADYFKAFVGGDMIVHGKPAPDIFLKAAELLSVEPSCCVAVEDALPGIISAGDAGMYTILVPDLAPADEEGRHAASVVAENMLGVLEQLKKLLDDRK